MSEKITGSGTWTVEDSYTCSTDTTKYTEDYSYSETVWNTAKVTSGTYEKSSTTSTTLTCFVPEISKTAAGAPMRVQLLGSGTIFMEAIAAAALLKKDWGVEADLWSCPSFNELARDGQDAERWNLLHPTEKPRLSFVARQLDKGGVR